MDVVFQLRMKCDIDGKESGELLLEFSNPSSSVIIVLLFDRVESTEKGASHTTTPAVIDADFARCNDVAAWTSWHKDTHFISILVINSRTSTLMYRPGMAAVKQEVQKTQDRPQQEVDRRCIPTELICCEPTC